jgi:putative glutamine amidotransferase
MQAGGVPVLIPSLIANDGWDTLYTRLNGILFTGGGDISLDYFPGDPQPLKNKGLGAADFPHPRIHDVDPQRDAVELNLLHASVADGKPFLGICRGCQLVNVGLGGTLYTHIPDQLSNALDHAYPGEMRTVLAHEVKIAEGTRIADVLGEPIVNVNSHHHQGLKDIAPSLRVAGHAPDGLVEAIELPDHPFGLAVQWHPEWLTDQQSTRNLFRRFVEAASE